MTPASIRIAVFDALSELTSYPVDAIADADDLVEDLGIDSMLAVSLLVAIESRVEMFFPDGSEAQLVGAKTVGELVQHVTDVLAFASESPVSAQSGAQS